MEGCLYVCLSIFLFGLAGDPIEEIGTRDMQSERASESERESEKERNSE